MDPWIHGCLTPSSALRRRNVPLEQYRNEIQVRVGLTAGTVQTHGASRLQFSRLELSNHGCQLWDIDAQLPAQVYYESLTLFFLVDPQQLTVDT
jgi:hypothetical protein